MWCHASLTVPLTPLTYTQSGLVESISAVTKEFKESRELLPIRACVLGPPAVGKTHMVAQLCKYYKLHHIKIADVIKEAIEKMVHYNKDYSIWQKQYIHFCSYVV